MPRVLPSRSTRRRAPKSRDPLSQLLASGALRAVVLYFATHPEEEPTVRGLARAAGLGPRSTGLEIGRLVALGVLDRRTRGPRDVRLGLKTEHPLWHALRSLVRAAAPAEDVLRAALADVTGIADAWIFGSTATGDDRPDSDVDVLIVGAPDERQLARRLIDAELLLGRDVQASTMTPGEWAEASTSGRPFFRALVAGPKRWLVQTGVPVRPGNSAPPNAGTRPPGLRSRALRRA